MKRFRRSARLLTLTIALTVGGALLPAQPAAAAEVPVRRAAADRVLPDRYLVRVSPGADPQQVAAALGVSPRGTWRTGTVRGFAATMSPDRLLAAQHRADVVAIEEDQRISVDPL